MSDIPENPQTGQRINSCTLKSCNNCSISDKTNCRFEIGQLFSFYLISLPAFFIGGAGISLYSDTALYIWLAILVLFFMVIEIRVLCAHCPHYERSKFFLSCWANTGAPKLWKYRPGPMNRIEKTILLAGFVLVWGYPALFIALQGKWLIWGGYALLTAMFFVVLRQKNCAACINFSCPLNRVDEDTKQIFFHNNPQISSHWENQK